MLQSLIIVNLAAGLVAGSPFDLFEKHGPKAGEVAPNVDLDILDGGRFRLEEATARGPVVFVFGSFT